MEEFFPELIVNMGFNAELGRFMKGVDLYGLMAVLFVGIQLLVLRVDSVEAEMTKLQERLKLHLATQSAAPDIAIVKLTKEAEQLRAKLNETVILHRQQLKSMASENNAAVKARVDLQAAVKMQELQKQVEQLVRDVYRKGG